MMVPNFIAYRVGWVWAYVLWNPKYGKFIPCVIKRRWNGVLRRKIEAETADDRSALKGTMEMFMAEISEQFVETYIDEGKTDMEILQSFDDCCAAAPLMEGLKPFLDTGVMELAKLRSIYEEQLFLARHRRKHGHTGVVVTP